jgi:hypothetical protein
MHHAPILCDFLSLEKKVFEVVALKNRENFGRLILEGFEVSRRVPSLACPLTHKV